MPPRPPALGLASDERFVALTGEQKANLSQALVVGTSPVNRVVVARILERSGLNTVSELPATAVDALLTLKPGVLVLDGGASDGECDEVLARIAEWRIEFGTTYPRVILLSLRGSSPANEALRYAVDAVVAKPFTPESLQPVVDKLLRQTGD